jgi:hypothetical protein
VVLMVMSIGRVPKPTSYRLFVIPQKPIVAGVSTPLDIQIVDQYGQPFTDFEKINFGQFSYYVSLAVVSHDLNFMEADPLLLNLDDLMASGMAGVGSGMMGSGSSAPQPVSSSSAMQTPITIKPEVVFPAEGQYVVFVDFWPRAGNEVTLSVPIEVGSALTPAAALTPDPSLTQTVGDLSVTLKYNGVLTAGQYQYINFEAVNSAGQSKTAEIEMVSGYRLNMYAVDESLSTFLKPDIISRRLLQFSVNFPRPGRYKVWFNFMDAGQPRQVSYILDVK